MEIFDTRAFALDPESSQKGPTEQQCVSDYLLRTHENYLLEQLTFIHTSIQLLVNFSTVFKLLYTEYNKTTSVPYTRSNLPLCVVYFLKK